eukprot:UN04872
MLNQKHAYNVIIRPKLSVVGKREDSKFYPLPTCEFTTHRRRDHDFMKELVKIPPISAD